MWRLKAHASQTTQRTKIHERLHRRATQSVPLGVLKGLRQRIKATIPVKPKYGLFRGTKTYSWHLNTTGPSGVSTNKFIADDDGKIYEIKIKYPAGSEYRFYLQLQIDRAIVFPADLSQNLRGDDNIDNYVVVIPFQRGTEVSLTMVSDATLAANTRMACWADVSVKYDKRT